MSLEVKNVKVKDYLPNIAEIIYENKDYAQKNSVFVYSFNMYDIALIKTRRNIEGQTMHELLYIALSKNIQRPSIIEIRSAEIKNRNLLELPLDYFQRIVDQLLKHAWNTIRMYKPFSILAEIYRELDDELVIPEDFRLRYGIYDGDTIVITRVPYRVMLPSLDTYTKY